MSSPTTFTIELQRSGGAWTASVTKGVTRLGESGSTGYRSRARHRTVRKAMRTISRIIANEHISDAAIKVVVRA